MSCNFRFLSDPTDSFLNPQLSSDTPIGAIKINPQESIDFQAYWTLAYKNVSIETHMPPRTLWQRIKNYFLGTEYLFTNTVIGKDGGSWICLEENFHHQILEYKLSPDAPNLIICKGSLVGNSSNVDIDTSYEGITGWLKGKGISTALATIDPETIDKTGKVFIYSLYGPIRAIKITSDQPVIVNNEALIGFTEGLDCSLKMYGGAVKPLLFSGQGFVCEFTGDGYVFTGGGKFFESSKTNTYIAAYHSSHNTNTSS